MRRALPARRGRVRIAAVVEPPLPATGSGSDVQITATASLPTRWATFTALAFRVAPDPYDHLALILGDVHAGVAADPVVVRVHSECLTGEALGSLRCDCGWQLEAAMERIAAAQRGVLVYLRGHEGRGIGLAAKLQAYALQEDGLDTVDANVALGHPVDARDFTPAAALLRRLGIERVELMTHNSAKTAALRAADIETHAHAPPSPPTPHNARYLHTKRTRLGHTDLTRPEAP